MTKRTRDDRGAAMVEFAIILPVLLMLVMGIIEFGRAYNTQISIQAAVREGARELALGKPSGEVEQRVIDAAPSADLTPANVSPGPPCPEGVDGKAVVEVTKDFTFNLPFMPDAFEPERELTATGVMRCGL